MCLLHRSKKISSSAELYVQELKRLRHIFRSNGYPDWFINNTIKKFEKRQNNPPDKYEPDFLFTIGIPVFGKASRVFAKRLNARGGVEDTRLEAKAKAKDTKKIRGQGQGQPFRGQNLSRPRTGMLEAKDQGHRRKCSPKKKVFKNFFQAISNSLAYPEFIGISLNHKSNEMTSSKIFQSKFLWDKHIVGWKI